MEIDIPLGGDVVFHGTVDIQMVFGKIGDQRPMGTSREILQLEAGQLQDHLVLRAQAGQLFDQRVPDVPPITALSPEARMISQAKVVVVVLPLLPVMP